MDYGWTRDAYESIAVWMGYGGIQIENVGVWVTYG